MTVTPDQIGGDLVPPRTPDATEVIQWARWIGDARLLIEARAAEVGVPFESLNERLVDYVVRAAVVAYVRNPDAASQQSETVSIDDGAHTVSRSFRGGSNGVTIIDDWWELLGLRRRAGKAFNIDTICVGWRRGHSRWCDVFFGGESCSCLAIINRNEAPLYEIDPDGGYGYGFAG